MLNKYSIRPVATNDLSELLEFINEVSAEEKAMISTQGQKLTLAQERKFLQQKIEQMKKHEAVQLVALCKKKIIATCSIDLQSSVQRHLGQFGVIVRKSYRQQGLGHKISLATIDTAQKQISQLQIVILHVFARNMPARKLYKKLGFKEYGLLPRGRINVDNTTEDEVFMFKNLIQAL
jgi:RimJ/RimL family protein N-acetyltransferase